LEIAAELEQSSILEVEPRVGRAMTSPQKSGAVRVEWPRVDEISEMSP
jgi:hypothetical protein